MREHRIGGSWALGLPLLVLLSGVVVPRASAAGTEPEKRAAWIAGTVAAEDGAPLVYANVFLVGERDGTCSRRDGTFVFKVEREGTYILQASYIGYVPWRETVTVIPGDTLRVDIVLSEKPVELAPVMVRASSFTAADEDGVTLTTLDIVTTPGAAADVFWAMKTFPGVQQVEEGAGLFVRGGDVSETITVLDGAILSHPYKYESPTGGFFGTISPFLLSGTYFSSGGFSAEYGNALSGAMVMESLGMPQSSEMTLGMGLAAGSIMARIPLVEDRLGLSLSGNQSFTETMFRVNGSTERFIEYPSSWDLNANIAFRPNESTTLKLFCFGEQDQLSVEVHDPDYRGVFSGWSENAIYNLALKQVVGKGLLLSANLARNRFSAKRQLALLDLRVDDWLEQGRVSAEYQIDPRAQIRTGLDWFRIGADVSGQVPVETYDLDPEGEVDPLDTHYRSHRPAGWVEGNLRLTERTVLIPGARVSYDKVSAETTFDPRFSMVYQLSPTSSLKLASGLYHQYPALMYYDPLSGNPELRAGRSRHLILGYDYRGETTQFRVEAYDKRYERLVHEDETLNYINGGHGYARGMDVFLKARLVMFEGWSSYSYLDAKRLEGEFERLTSPDFDVTHNWTLVLKCGLPYGLFAGSTYRYATGKPYTPGPGRHNEDRVPPYKKLDLSLSTIRPFFGGKIVYYLAAANILNRTNIFDYRYSEDFSRREPVSSSFGRSVYFGASVMF